MFSDCLLQHVQSSHDYILMRYISLLPAWFHLSFASTTRPTTESRWTLANSSSSFSPAVIRWPTPYNENAVAESRTISSLESLIENQWRAGGSSSALTTLRSLELEIDFNIYWSGQVGLRSVDPCIQGLEWSYQKRGVVNYDSVATFIKQLLKPQEERRQAVVVPPDIYWHNM